MKRVRASSGHQVAAAVAAVDVTAAADMAAGVTVASEEAATSQQALPADACYRIRCLSGFSFAIDLILSTEHGARHTSVSKIWAGLDSNQRRRKASRFTVCPVWPLRYLPISAREFIYPRAPKLATRISFPPDIEGLNQTVSS